MFSKMESLVLHGNSLKCLVQVGFGEGLVGLQVNYK